MPLQSSVRASKKPLRLDDEVRFLRSWIEKPLHMGAVMPSGRLLARTMAQYVDADAEGPVVELGPGTGAITNALIEHGVDQKRLVLVEYNPGFCALLRERYPQAKVVQGDAYRLRDTLWDVMKSPASAVVSGLPLVTKPMLTRLKLIRDAFLALAPGAPFVQQLAKHLDARAHRLGGVPNTDDFDFLVDFNDASLDSTGNYGAATGDGEYIFDRHQERLVKFAHRLGNERVDCVHEFDNLVAPLFVAFEGF